MSHVSVVKIIMCVSDLTWNARDQGSIPLWGTAIFFRTVWDGLHLATVQPLCRQKWVVLVTIIIDYCVVLVRCNIGNHHFAKNDFVSSSLNLPDTHHEDSDSLLEGPDGTKPVVK